MLRTVNTREREKEILDKIIESYIEESKPISSGYLCRKYNLPYSSATVRNVMESLEERGLISNIHTSSGRVPTKEGFRYYIDQLKQDNHMVRDYPLSEGLFDWHAVDMQEALNNTLDILAELSGHTSMVAISAKSSHGGVERRIFLRGARYILNQPEFEDVTRLRNLLYALEVRVDSLQDLLFNSFDDGVSIFIGDDIGCAEIKDCSLIVSGTKDDEVTFSLGLLGPMRMDYISASSCICSVKKQLRGLLEEYL